MRLRPRITPWVLALDVSGPNGPMNQREYCQEAKRICERRFQESGQPHLRLHPREQVRMRQCDQTNHLLGTSKVRSASTQRQAGSGMTLSQQQALLRLDGNRLRGGSLLHGHRHQNEVSDFFYKSKCFAYRQRRKLEVPMSAAMPCKIRRRTYKETCRIPDTPKTKYACIVEAG